jgi:hypothetical protein
MEAENKGIYVTATDSTTPDLTITQSLQSIPLKRRQQGAIRKHLSVSIPEKDEVERLDLWSRSGANQVTRKPIPGPALYRGRFGDLDRILTQRKTKSLLPPLLRQSQGLRDAKLQTETNQREQAKYSKIYEDEVHTKLKETEARLHSLLIERDNVREANSALKVSLEPVIVREKEKDKRDEVAKKRRGSTLNSLAKADRVEKTITRVEEKSEAEKAEIRTQIEGNVEKVAELGQALKATKRLLKALKEEQVQHYYNLLKEGLDTRSEGLSWIVQSLWQLGKSTPSDIFPSYLEAETITVILTIAEKYQQISDLAEQIEEQEMKLRRASVTARSYSDRWNQVQDRLRSLGHNIVTSEPNGKVPVSLCPSPHPTLISKPSQQINSKIENIRSEIAAIQTSEVRRLMHESCFHRLEQRLGVSIWRLLGAVMGAEVVARQMSWITKEQSRLLQEQTRTKTYWFG